MTWIKPGEGLTSFCLIHPFVSNLLKDQVVFLGGGSTFLDICPFIWLFFLFKYYKYNVYPSEGYYLPQILCDEAKQYLKQMFCLKAKVEEDLQFMHRAVVITIRVTNIVLNDMIWVTIRIPKIILRQGDKKANKYSTG